jgi:hypothetical protein
MFARYPSCHMFGDSVSWYPVVSRFKSQRSCGRVLHSRKIPIEYVVDKVKSNPSTPTNDSLRQPSQTPNSCSHAALRALHDRDSRRVVQGRCASAVRGLRRGSLSLSNLLTTLG